MGRCRLCLEERELKRSHILPDFAGRWLKDSSATGYLRHSKAPNKRHQDTSRLYLLCGACEQRFAVWERAFQRELFARIVRDEGPPFRYGPWLLLFGVSVCWRVVLQALESGHDLRVLTDEQRGILPEAMEQWRTFLLGIQENPGVHRVQFLPLGVLAGLRGVQPPAGMNTYLVRTLQQDVIGAGEANGALAFAKIGPAGFVGFISPPRRPEHWKGTGLHVKRGEVPRHLGMPIAFFRYLEEQASQMATGVREDMSPRQHAKIIAAYQRDPERVAQSHTSRVIRADIAMFGDGFLRPRSGARESDNPLS